MSSKRGRMQYVPKIIVEEVDMIQTEFELPNRVDAYKEMVSLARTGREFLRMADRNRKRKKKGDNFRFGVEFDPTRILR